MKAGVEDIRKHEFFADTEWLDIIKKKVSGSNLSKEGLHPKHFQNVFLWKEIILKIFTPPMALLASSRSHRRMCLFATVLETPATSTNTTMMMTRMKIKKNSKVQSSTRSNFSHEQAFTYLHIYTNQFSNNIK